MNTQLEALKACLLRHGVEAVEDFLGYEVPCLESSDVLDRRMDMAFEQMPDEHFQQFLHKYMPAAEGSNVCDMTLESCKVLPKITPPKVPTGEASPSD